MCSEDDKSGWEAINNPKELSKWMEHMRTKADYKEAVVDGTFDNMVSEAEYKYEGDR